MTTIQQLEPVEREVELEGLYLAHDLQGLASRLGRPIVIANYITDLDDVIATPHLRGAPRQIQNPWDWHLFQELTAQSDLIFTGTSYMSKFAIKGGIQQDVFTQFDAGAEFSGLGDWREDHGLPREPDLGVFSRSLAFDIPAAVIESGRRVFVFTIEAMKDSSQAATLEASGAAVIVGGETGVEGAAIVERLADEGCRVMKVTTGPRSLAILMDAGRVRYPDAPEQEGAIDRLYITRVDRRIEVELRDRITVLEDRKVTDLEANGSFNRIERYLHSPVTVADGTETSQEFILYQRSGLE